MPPRATGKGRPCLVCRHPACVEIETAVIAGGEYVALGKKHGLHPDAIARHCKKHVSDADRAAYIADISVKDLAQKASESGLALLDYWSVTRHHLMMQLLHAVDAGDQVMVINTSRALNEVLRSIGKLTGELSSLASSHLTITNNVNLVNSPIFADLQSMLVARLTPYPAALQAVLAGLEALEAKASQGSPQPQQKLIDLQPNESSSCG